MFCLSLSLDEVSPLALLYACHSDHSNLGCYSPSRHCAMVVVDFALDELCRKTRKWDVQLFTIMVTVIKRQHVSSAQRMNVWFNCGFSKHIFVFAVRDWRHHADSFQDRRRRRHTVRKCKQTMLTLLIGAANFF